MRSDVFWEFLTYPLPTLIRYFLYFSRLIEKRNRCTMRYQSRNKCRIKWSIIPDERKWCHLVPIIISDTVRGKRPKMCLNYGNTGCGVFKGGIQN